MIRLVAHWVGRGWSNDEILATCAGITLPGYTVDETSREVTTAIDGARKKWGVADEDRKVGPGEPASPFGASILDPWDTLQVPAFPIHALPEVLRDFVERRARVVGADLAAVAWGALSACSAALDARIRIKPKKHDSWRVPPMLWVVLIGPSSAKKTPA
jgi:hypothetical protein